MVKQADGIAERAHRGQKDRLGRPYIGHCRRVAQRVSTPQAKASALLHDVLERCDVTAGELLTSGIPQTVVECVILLTRREDVPDDEYYRRIRSNEVAYAVKLADLADNADPARLTSIGEPTQTQLRTKYRNAYDSLGQPELAAALS